MKTLKNTIKKLSKGDIGEQVRSRVQEFSSHQIKSSKIWFEELCFCILAANAKSATSWAIQKELGYKGLMNLNQSELSSAILRNKHRFHNNKARYIIEARRLDPLKKTVLDLINNEGQEAARHWLVENVKGFGYKEGSHYLRNMGYYELAILDRHILNVMLENGMIDEIPKTISKKVYFEMEKIFQKFARSMEMSCGELDLYFWYMKAGAVMK